MINPMTPTAKVQGIASDVIRFDDFEISWAGPNPLGSGYAFGSDDGRFLEWTAGRISQPVRLSGSEEAINGLARTNHVLAVSTRYEVSFYDLRHPLGEKCIGIHDGGAHGVLATPSGGFVAPLGFNGLLRMPPAKDGVIRTDVKYEGSPVNLYKIENLGAGGETDTIICAARRHGLMTFELDWTTDEGRVRQMPSFRAPGMDIVDVCHIGTIEWPFAAAALGDDGSLHLFRDVLASTPPISFAPGNFDGGAYSLLHHKGSLFLLTSEEFYFFPGLADRFLANETEKPQNPTLFTQLQAIEAYIIHDQVALVLPGQILFIPIESIVAKDESSRSTRNNPLPNMTNAGWEISTDLVEIPSGLTWSPAEVA